MSYANLFSPLLVSVVGAGGGGHRGCAGDSRRKRNRAAGGSGHGGQAGDGGDSREEDHRPLPLAGGRAESGDAGVDCSADEIYGKLLVAGADSPGDCEAGEGTGARRKLLHSGRAAGQVFLYQAAAGGKPGVDLYATGVARKRGAAGGRGKVERRSKYVGAHQ